MPGTMDGWVVEKRLGGLMDQGRKGWTNERF